MAQRVATKGKRKQYKRETNAQRVAREDDRRYTNWAAFEVGLLIEFETRAFRAGLCDGRGDKSQGRRLESGSSEIEFYEGKRVIWKGFYASGERAYTVIGRLLCQSHENPSKFLRLVADQIEGKEPYSPGDYWYDDAIRKAYDEACRRFFSRDLKSDRVRWPTFSEFENVFSKQNPKLHGASDRSLRRSLRRMGYITHAGKRGRPKEK